MLHVRKNDVEDSTDYSDLGPLSEINIVDNGELFYLKDMLLNILTLNIKDFNYIIFEEDLNNMYKEEFLNFFKHNMVPLVEKLNEYIAIGIEPLMMESYEIKLSFCKNIIKFVMNTLPYSHVKEFLSKSDVNGYHDALDEFNDDIVAKISNQIEIGKKQFDNFNSLMENVEDTISNEKKRDKFNKSLTLLDQSMKNKITLLDYHKSIIDNSGNDKLCELLKLYLANDSENIL